MSAATATSGDRCNPAAAAKAFPNLSKLIDYLGSLDRRADLTVLTKLLHEVTITRADILPACIFGTGGYRRNTIAESEWFELPRALLEERALHADPRSCGRELRVPRDRRDGHGNPVQPDPFWPHLPGGDDHDAAGVRVARPKMPTFTKLRTCRRRGTT
jgi:hypothetical protein